MLSYRHSYHAGNYADVLKHIVQIAILQHLNLKDKPYCVIDTHAGAGGYKLTSAHAQKTQEYVTGIGRLWQEKPPVESDALNAYLKAVETFNNHEKLLNYPGSPYFTKSMMRHKDQLFAHEIHPTDIQLLKAFAGRDRQMKVLEEDGFVNAIGLVPPAQKRGLMLIDPPYEIKKDYDNVVDLIVKAYNRFSSGTYAIWYPVVQRERITRMQHELMDSGIRNIQRYEIAVQPDSDEFGMTAAGMIVINPPWTLMRNMQAIMPYLADMLSLEAPATYLAEQWVEE
ncbi:23S rRNA (adenine(2030)-N(6))-methyltransferase RlmJ [Algibacillus agarilyticus]|uniref:23S rRNA (adenine(2030)-N(6))-methyltransferase RlmJ n=1 Tax=Algibacillus agarilyticus TaxID=2234133 RepID=UPI000DCFBDFF|nr:23S rRNA (adenine(2030)-N(6))-methyltransferase RlmJ [Algibacillus agarilyticus]